MGYPPGNPLYAQAVQILQRPRHHGRDRTGSSRNRPSATNALRSTFALACESPTAVGIGL